jgi:hypothetical protein
MAGSDVQERDLDFAGYRGFNVAAPLLGPDLVDLSHMAAADVIATAAAVASAATLDLAVAATAAAGLAALAGTTIALGAHAAQSILANATGSPANAIDVVAGVSTILARGASGNLGFQSGTAVKTILAIAFTDVSGILAAAQHPALAGDVTSVAGSLTTTLATTGVGAGSFGDASHVGAFTVDAKGRLTAASGPAIAIDATAITTGFIAAARMPAHTGDVTTVAGNIATTLAASGVTAGTYGDASHHPTITVDAKGRVTVAVSTSIAIDTAAIVSGTLAAARMPALTGAVTTVAGAVATTLAAGAVANSNRANMAANTLSGNATAGLAPPTDLVATSVKTLLAIAFTDVSGTIATARVTGLAAIATSGSATDLTTGAVPAARMPAFTGDVTTVAGALATTLAASGVTAGTYGDASHHPVLTLDAKGRATLAVNTAIAIDAAAITTGTIPSARISVGAGITMVGGAITNDFSTGKAGGLTVIGSTLANQSLQLQSTTNASRGGVWTPDSLGIGRIASFGGLPPQFAITGNVTLASATSAVLDYITIDPATVTITGSTPITTAAGFNHITINAPAYSTTVAIGAGGTTPAAATLVVTGAPTISGGGSFTGQGALALWVKGPSQVDGHLTVNGIGYFSSRLSLTAGNKLGFVDTISTNNPAWQIGYEATPAGATMVTGDAIVQSVYFAAASGFMIRNYSGLSLFEVRGSDGAAYHAGPLGIQGTPSARYFLYATGNATNDRAVILTGGGPAMVSSSPGSPIYECEFASTATFVAPGFSNNTEFAHVHMGAPALVDPTGGAHMGQASTLLIEGAPVLTNFDNFSFTYAINVKAGTVLFQGALFIVMGSTQMGGLIAAGNVVLGGSSGTTSIYSFASSQFIAGSGVAVSLGSSGPTGSHSAPQEWLQFRNGSGVMRYVPCF